MADCSSHGVLRRPPALLVVFLLSAAWVCRADIEADRKECTDQLLQLQPCLPYVSKQGPKPTPDCCTSLKQVLSKSLRCLCILIKDKDDPSVKNFHIDLDRALSIPNACGLNASTSECPKLLNLAPNSPEAQLFKDVEGKLHGSNSTGGSNPGSATAGTPSTGTSSSGGVRRRYYAGMGSPLGWLGGGLWVYSIVAAALLLAALNVQGA